jgi:DNA polymerase-3 subunit epsilon
MQASFEDLGTPLHQVTFCVVDIETTGGAAADGGITEVGAARFRGGECLGTFRTFVNPGCAIPRQITLLTGITQAMVAPAPPPDAVLPTFGEFLGDAVVVGHNVRYDLGYLNAAAERDGRPRFDNRSVDTLALARRLVRDEVPNCRLATLAERFRLDHRPSHRALDDALATADLLHLLLERADRLGVCGLDDLRALPTMAGHAQASKLRLTDHLPRGPGVYLFRDRAGRTLYVGKATNLRSRVRSYFSTDQRRKVGALLRETERIDHVTCPTPLEAAVLEVRLIHRLEPRFNRQATTWRRYVYLKLTDEAFPRLSVVRTIRADRALYLGPLPSTRAAKRVAEAIETAVALRRCTATPGRQARSGPCAPAQIGVATCPCAGSITEVAYRRLVDTVRRGLRHEPELLLAPIEAKMAALAGAERFEEAAEMRDRAAALAGALRRQRRTDALRRAGRMVVEVEGRSGVELVGGRLARSWTIDGRGIAPVPLPLDLDPAPPDSLLTDPDNLVTDPDNLVTDLDSPGAPLPKALADEMACVAAWLDKEAGRIRLVHADRGLASPYPALPTYRIRSRSAPSVRSPR